MPRPSSKNKPCRFSDESTIPIGVPAGRVRNPRSYIFHIEVFSLFFSRLQNSVLLKIVLKLYDCVKNCQRFKSGGKNGFAGNFSFLRRAEPGITRHY